MKRIIPVLTAIILFLCTCIGIDLHYKQVLKDYKQVLTYHNNDTRNFCIYAMDLIIDETTIPFFGSSELDPIACEDMHPRGFFHEGNSDYNVIPMGRSYMQSLHHAVTLGALADMIPEKKVVLNLSPQWFTASHLSSEMYSSRFSERQYDRFMKNKDISYDTKAKVTARMKSLLTADANELKIVEKYEDIYLKKSFNPLTYAEIGVRNIFMDIRQRYLLQKEIVNYKFNNDSKIIAEDIDWDEKMLEAEREGEAACTNNDFYIYDHYFDTYVRDSMDSRKGSSANSSFLRSQEYDDLRLFLTVCKETGIEPLIINVPVNGYWYDWEGFPNEDREGYYQNIRNICEEYQVQLLDLSDKEYEPYFLKDIMHMGWKGWVYINEAVYKFYKGIS